TCGSADTTRAPHLRGPRHIPQLYRSARSSTASALRRAPLVGVFLSPLPGVFPYPLPVGFAPLAFVFPYPLPVGFAVPTGLLQPLLSVSSPPLARSEEHTSELQ